MLIRLCTCCYALLPVVTSLEPKDLSNQIPCSNLIFVSNPRIPCYICPLALLRVVTGCYALLHVITSLEGKSLSNQFTGPHFIFVSNPRIPCCICSLGCYVLLRVVTRCYILLHLQRGKVCQISLQVPILYQFPTHEYLVAYVPWACYLLLRLVTLRYIFRWEYLVKYFPRFPFYISSNPRIPSCICPLDLLRVVKGCYALLHVIKSLDGKSLSNQFPGSHFILVSNPRIPCCICSVGLLRVVTCCYLLLHLQRKNFVKLVSMFPFYIRLQPTNTLLHMFIGLVTRCYLLLHLQRRKVCQNRFQVPILYQFPTHEYLVTYVHWACYVLLRVVTRCYMLLHPQREKVCQITFQVPIFHSLPTHEYLAAYVHQAVTCCYVLLRVVTFYYIFRGEKFVKLVSRFQFIIRFQPTNTLLHRFIGLVTCCSALLSVVTSLKVCQISFQVPILYQFPTQRISCCIGSLGLLRVVTHCYLSLHIQMGIFSQISSQGPIYIRFQPTNTLLHMFIWLVTCCYALLQVVTSLEGISLSKYFPCSNLIFVSNPPISCCICSLDFVRVVTRCYILLHLQRGNVSHITFQVPILYQFPTHEYLVAYVPWACYVL